MSMAYDGNGPNSPAAANSQAASSSYSCPDAISSADFWLIILKPNASKPNLTPSPQLQNGAACLEAYGKPSFASPRLAIRLGS